MKLHFAAACLLPFASAFVQQPNHARVGTGLFGVVTGPEGKAATSAEEDLMLTLALIMDHEARSSTASKDQMISQMSDSDSSDKEIDVSIPYDAPAKLAYESSDKAMEYGAFKTKFEADAVADAIAKKAQI